MPSLPTAIRRGPAVSTLNAGLCVENAAPPLEGAEPGVVDEVAWGSGPAAAGDGPAETVGIATGTSASRGVVPRDGAEGLAAASGLTPGGNGAERSPLGAAGLAIVFSSGLSMGRWLCAGWI